MLEPDIYRFVIGAERFEASNTIVLIFKSVVAATNTFALWKLILETHLHGTSSKAKSKSLTNLGQCNQIPNMPHEEFLSKFNAFDEVVRNNFESAEYAGYIKLDDLLKTLVLVQSFNVQRRLYMNLNLMALWSNGKITYKHILLIRLVPRLWLLMHLL
jgi:hypothetical protein